MARRLHNKIIEIGRSEMYGFANPVAIGDSSRTDGPNCNGTIRVRAGRLAKNFENGYTENKLYFVPYLQCGHWVLMLVNPLRNTVQWLDSIGGKITVEARDLVTRAVATFHQQRDLNWSSTQLVWEVTEVTRQPSTTECALCVMRNMDLIISQGLTHVDERLERLGRYKREHLAPVKEDWSKFFVTNVLQGP